jgi:hypothetical protein
LKSYTINRWRIADRICGKIRLETFREAVRNSKIRRRLKIGKQKRKTQLIVDGGSENNNKTVNTFIKRKDTPLNKVIALKDILRSNSMVEYTNRVIYYIPKCPIGVPFFKNQKRFNISLFEFLLLYLYFFVGTTIFLKPVNEEIRRISSFFSQCTL